MKAEDIVAFTRIIEPTPDIRGAPAYRCAAYLTDGLYLPCVLLASASAQVELAMRRFQETRADARRLPWRRRFGSGMEYPDIVSTFVASGNRVNWYDIKRLEKSRFAIPASRAAEIDGETSMSWTQFAGIMGDGKEFYFGTTFHAEFFSMPEGYTGEDIVKVIPHKRGEGELYRERPFFTCFVEGL